MTSFHPKNCCHLLNAYIAYTMHLCSSTTSSWFIIRSCLFMLTCTLTTAQHHHTCLSLIPSWWGRVITPFCSRGIFGQTIFGGQAHVSRQIWSCVRHCKIRCSAFSSVSIAVETCSRVLTPNMMEVRCQQRKVATGQCRHTLPDCFSWQLTWLFKDVFAQLILTLLAMC